MKRLPPKAVPKHITQQALKAKYRVMATYSGVPCAKLYLQRNWTTSNKLHRKSVHKYITPTRKRKVSGYSYLSRKQFCRTYETGCEFSCFQVVCTRENCKGWLLLFGLGISVGSVFLKSCSGSSKFVTVIPGIALVPANKKAASAVACRF